MDIVGIAETNCEEKKGRWFGEKNDKFRIHWSSDGKGSGVALIVTKTLNKYVCGVRSHRGRAISLNLVLPRKTTICMIQIYLSSKKSEQVDTFHWIKKCIIEAQQKNHKIMVMGDFNAVPSPRQDRNNNSNSNTPESKIFPLLTSCDLIDCYRLIYPEKAGFTWQRDNSWEKSRIDAIWVPHKWEDRIEEFSLDELSLITNSDHKFLSIKIKKNWQIKVDGQAFVQVGPKYNMKLMNDERWSKFSSTVETMVKNSSASNRQESYEKNFNSLNKMWSTLKNIMTEAANQSIPKLKQKKKRQLIKASVATNFKIAKSINKIYKL